MGEIQLKNNIQKNQEPLKSFSNPYSPCFYLNKNEYKNKQTIQSVIEETLKEESTIFKDGNKQDKKMFGKDNEILDKDIRHYSCSTNDTQIKNSPCSIFLNTSIEESENTTQNENEDDLIISKSSSLQSDIRKLYKFKDFLGEGHFGSVRTAYRKKECCMRKLFAVKSISKKKLLAKDLDDLIREVDIISSLDHPCIIKFYETFHDSYYFHIITELCRGKDLHERVKSEGGKIKENNARIIIMKILNAINYCHSFDIVHRDLKPENIIFESPYENEEDEKGEEDENEEYKNLFCLKIIDFGLSIKKKREEKLRTILGTPYYMAPEVLKGNYNENCDIWSIGAITYYILSGHVPFNGQSNAEVFAKIVYDEPSFNNFKGVSKLAIDFIKKCFIKNPDKRMNCKEALRHPWFEVLYKKINSKDSFVENILNNLSNFEKYPKLKKIVVKHLINNMGHVELRTYKRAFFAFDGQRTGVITSDEIKNIFTKYNKTITEKQIKNIMSVSDEPNKNYLTFSEFIMCSIELRDFLTPGKLLNAFNFFDMDYNSYIDINDINNTLLRWGKDVINKQDLEKIINETTKGQDNKINLEHFLNIFSKEIDANEYLAEINKIKIENEKQIQIRKAKTTKRFFKNIKENNK